MAFHTYQCEQYIKFLEGIDKEMPKIYELIEASPISKAKMAERLKMTRQTFQYKFQTQTLEPYHLIHLLNFIK